MIRMRKGLGVHIVRSILSRDWIFIRGYASDYMMERPLILSVILLAMKISRSLLVFAI